MRSANEIAEALRIVERERRELEVQHAAAEAEVQKVHGWFVDNTRRRTELREEFLKLVEATT